MLTKTEQQRERLIANVLDMAVRRGLPVTIAARLDDLIAVRDPETDTHLVVRIRDLRPDHVRID